MIATRASAQDSQPVRWRVNFDIGPTYNRVETIPISVGPQIEIRGDNPTRFAGRIIVRLGDLPVELERVGFRARVEQLFLARRFRFGLAGWEEVQSPEDRGLFNLENSLAAFIFRDDRRDYFRAAGGAAYLVYSPPESPWLIGAQFQVDWQKPVATGDPPSIFDQRTPWRLNSLAADGRIDILSAAVHYDTRPQRAQDRLDPHNAWWVRLDFNQGTGGTLQAVAVTDGDGNLIPVPQTDNQPTFGSLDIRRYNEIMNLGVNLRAVGAGSLTSKPLAAQFQHAPGGVGTLPGYELLIADCGARSQVVGTVRPTLSGATGNAFYPYYGCDRYVLLQLEVNGFFGFKIGKDRSQQNPWEAGGFAFELIPMWALFLDASTGWASDEPSPYSPPDEPWRYDVGGGIMLGDFGAFIAYPLTGANKVVRVAIRIGRRF